MQAVLEKPLQKHALGDSNLRLIPANEEAVEVRRIYALNVAALV